MVLKASIYSCVQDYNEKYYFSSAVCAKFNYLCMYYLVPSLACQHTHTHTHTQIKGKKEETKEKT